MLRMRLFTCCLLLLAFTACGTSRNDGPAPPINGTSGPPPVAPKYYSQDGRFKIGFPGEPTVFTEKVPTEVGELDMTSFIWEKYSGEAYMASFTDYPAGLLKGVQPEELLQSAKDGILENMQTRPSAEEPRKLGDYPGMYFKAANDDISVVYLMYMVDNRLYQLVVSRSGQYPDEDAANTFLLSFELVK